MTRNIDVYDGFPNETINAFEKDQLINHATLTGMERDLIRRFMYWATLPATYQEAVERFDTKGPSIDDRVARSLESISETLAKINVNMANISRNSNRIGIR